jgi:BASS family bile acid:Na+ symporter
MKAILDIGVLIVTILIMTAVGMGLEKRHFSEVARRKGMLLLTLVAQTVVLPLLGLALVRVMALPPHLSAGILLLAACPVGDLANFFTLLARANVALSVTLNTLSCLLSVVTMAAVFGAYGYLTGERFPFAVPPPALVAKMTVMVVLPIVAGMGVRRFRPAFVERYAKTLQTIGICGVAFLVAYVLTTRRDQLTEGWQQTAVAGAAFMTTAMLSGLAFGGILKLTAGDGVTVGISFAVRNVALALAIAVTLLNRTEYAVFAVVYFLTEVPLLLGAAAAYRRWWGRDALIPYGGCCETVSKRTMRPAGRNEGMRQ